MSCELSEPFEPNVMSVRPIYGTAYKISDFDVSFAARQLADFMDHGKSIMFRQNATKLENKLTCTDLSDYCARSLSGIEDKTPE
jgi:hypothetical protein